MRPKARRCRLLEVLSLLSKPLGKSKRKKSMPNTLTADGWGFQTAANFRIPMHFRYEVSGMDKSTGWSSAGPPR